MVCLYRSKHFLHDIIGSKDIARVGTVSAGDAQIGQLIADAMSPR